MTRSRKPTPPAASTKDLLIAAAQAEFGALGYAGTDTNKIARRAGFAPQTFYRHFDDKLDAFLAVYALWRADEARAIAEVVRAERDPSRRAAAAAKTLVSFHVAHAVFRRSLRNLAVSEPRVRAARAESRSAQIAALAAIPANAGRSRASLLAAILDVERLCDAVADAETDDVGVSAAVFQAEITNAVARARGEAER